MVPPPRSPRFRPSPPTHALPSISRTGPRGRISSPEPARATKRIARTTWRSASNAIQWFAVFSSAGSRRSSVIVETTPDRFGHFREVIRLLQEVVAGAEAQFGRDDVVAVAAAVDHF